MARSKVKIIVDILETVKKENNCSKTRIIRFANLDWDMASKYLSKMIKDGFLVTIESETRGNEEYKITERGEILLESLEKVRDACSIL